MNDKQYITGIEAIKERIAYKCAVRENLRKKCKSLAREIARADEHIQQLTILLEGLKHESESTIHE